MPKASDRIKTLQQQRAAALAPPPPASTAPASEAPEHEVDVATVQAHFGGVLDQVVRDRQVQRIPIGHIAPDTRPGMQQPRLLPHPHELTHQNQPVAKYADLVTELLALGRSLQERQVQPIIIYPGTSDEYPAARYLLLVGQRRWTAAHLVGLDTLDAIVVDPPSPADRVRIQYAENEDREEFSDMERAWALQQMKQVLNDAPWEAVEARLQMSRTRRHQLIRLLTFSAAQQVEVARLRLQETQIRPLHTALRNQELNGNQIDSVLKRLSEIALGRATEKPSGTPDEVAADTVAPRRSGIDGPTVARLVARTCRAAAPMPQIPRWLPLLEEQIARTRQALQRSTDRVEALGSADAQRLQEAARQLRQDIDRVVTALERHKQGQELQPDSR